MEGKMKTDTDFDMCTYVYIIEYSSSQGFIKCKRI